VRFEHHCANGSEVLQKMEGGAPNFAARFLPGRLIQRKGPIVAGRLGGAGWSFGRKAHAMSRARLWGYQILCWVLAVAGIALLLSIIW
jgi:hypothetical protein